MLFIVVITINIDLSEGLDAFRFSLNQCVHSRERARVRAFPILLNVYPTAGTVAKNKQASDWQGVTTFFARCSQRRGGARAGVARVRLSLPRTTASRKNEREKRSRDR